MRSSTVINEGPANEVLIVFKAPIFSTQHQTLSDTMLNYDNHVDFSYGRKTLAKGACSGDRTPDRMIRERTP